MAFVGTPPLFRGTTLPGRDIELQLVQHFPQIAIFLEKPISAEPNIAEVEKLEQVFKEKGTVVCVAYMLRYVRAVQEMKWVGLWQSTLMTGGSLRRMG